MTERTPAEPQGGKRRLSEDWMSVVIGLIIVALVALLGLSAIPWPLFGVF